MTGASLSGFRTVPASSSLTFNFPMEPTKNPVPAVNPANENETAALAVIVTVLKEAVENNREQTRFANDQEMTEQLDSELSELETALAWAKFAAKAQPSPVRLVYGSLSCVPTSDLIGELRRRQEAIDLPEKIEPCVLVAVTPSDLSDYWDCDESGAANPASELPTGEQWQAIRRAFERWQDRGGYTEIMETCRDAWNESKENKEGGKNE